MLTAEKLRLKKLLSDSISVLCRTSLQFQSSFSVEALLGITLDENEVVLISIKETVVPDGNLIQKEWLDNSTVNAGVEDVPVLEVDQDFDFCSQQESNWSNPAEYNDQVKNRLKTDQKRNIKKPRDQIQQKVNSASKGQIFNMNRGVQFIKNEEVDLDETNYVNEDLDFQDGSIKMEATEVVDSDSVDDCMIVKNEEMIQMNNFDYYNDGHPQEWNTQNDSFSGDNDFTQIPNESTAVGTCDPDQDWLPYGQGQISRKYRAVMPVKRRRPFETKRISSVSTKSHKMSITTKIQMKTSEAYYPKVPEDLLDAEEAIGRPVMQCAYCSAVFTKSHVLKEHVNGIHFKKKLFRCVDCGESFKWRAELSRHRRMPGLCPCQDTTNQTYS